jgi:hypothetical protein
MGLTPHLPSALSRLVAKQNTHGSTLKQPAAPFNSKTITSWPTGAKNQKTGSMAYLCAKKGRVNRFLASNRSEKALAETFVTIRAAIKPGIWHNLCSLLVENVGNTKNQRRNERWH